MIDAAKIIGEDTRAQGELELLRIQFVSYCAKHGFADHAEPHERLFDLAAAFAWLRGAK